MNYNDLIRGFLPALTGFGISRLCLFNKQESNKLKIGL